MMTGSTKSGWLWVALSLISGCTGLGALSNDSFAGADPITSSPTMGTIDPAGDVDYYSFRGNAGDWVLLEAQIVNPSDDPALDTVLTLYDASMTQIAENDDFFGAEEDSFILSRLPADGLYYVLVQDVSTWASDAPRGSPSFQYALRQAVVSRDVMGVHIEAESGDDAASAQALTFTSNLALIGGSIDAPTDVDVFSLDITSGTLELDVLAPPTGPHGDGSTIDLAHVWVTDAGGSEIVARVDPTQAPLQPSLPAGSYLLWVDAAGRTGGANDFYALALIQHDDNPPETMEAQNDDPSTPETISIASDTGDGYVLAHLPDGDTDYYAFDVADGQVVSISCGSRTRGSGVIDLQGTLLDPTGPTTIVSATETDTDPLRITDQAVPAAGTYLLELTRGSQDPEVSGDYVRCGIHLTSGT